MKKFITFWVMTILLAFTIPTVAQDSLTVSTVVNDQLVTSVSDLVTNTNAEKLVDKYIDKAGAIIMSLAKTLQVPAEHVYSILVKQQSMNAICNLIFILFSFLIFAVFLYLCISKKNYVWRSDGTIDEPKPIAIASWLLSAISLIMFVISLSNLEQILMGLFNPEYGAIKEIMRLF